jgi:pimeloyl-ACP methyl ester carboxylesterase
MEGIFPFFPVLCHVCRLLSACVGICRIKFKATMATSRSGETGLSGGSALSEMAMGNDGRNHLANGAKAVKERLEMRVLRLLLVSLALVWGTTGCGTYVAHRLVQAPNSYPTWFAPKARVMLGFSPKFLSSFPSRFMNIGPPKAQMYYRVVNPADYHLKISSTNWVENGRPRFEFDFHAKLPGVTNQWSAKPRGTVILLHGYGLAQFSMAPWALRLAEDGWRCVLVDLRGHGKSTGKKIYFGIHETHDLSQLLDKLMETGQLTGPVAVMGESYGAALALRWHTTDARVGTVVIAPYGSLSNAVMNIRRDYVGWMPPFLLREGLRKLPKVLQVGPEELDTTTVLKRSPVTALFIAGGDDHIAPAADVENLKQMAGQGSELIVEPNATHESVTYYFHDLAPPVLAWLAGETAPATGANQQVVLPSPQRAKAPE